MTDKPTKAPIPQVTTPLRSHSIVAMPQEIYKASGIAIFGKRIKSIIFTTDMAIIRNNNADAVLAVYPFTPQQVISHAIINAAYCPVFCGVGGGITGGSRTIFLAKDAEAQGAMGVVVNAPTNDDVIRGMKEVLDIPIIVTIISDHSKVAERLKAGASILNVSGGKDTPEVVRQIRQSFPDVPIIATGGPTGESILETVEAGANAISYTPPTSQSILATIMDRYRDQGL
ncbi:MAG: hydrolase [Eubacteriales bacterium]|jgi:2-keto-3-deoxy-6-phosphogluconate aldolase|nr:hydrolase [Eubacteriales bacterium]